MGMNMNMNLDETHCLDVPEIWPNSQQKMGSSLDLELAHIWI